MNPILLTALIFAFFAFLAYILLALKNNKTADLSDGVQIFVGVTSFFGGIKLIMFGLSGEFARVVSIKIDHNPPFLILGYISFDPKVLTLSPDDTAFIVIGGIALMWISIQTISNSYRKVL